MVLALKLPVLIIPNAGRLVTAVPIQRRRRLGGMLSYYYRYYYRAAESEAHTIAPGILKTAS
jgi:hypothetical protein